jgi:hypothetical protein
LRGGISLNGLVSDLLAALKGLDFSTFFQIYPGCTNAKGDTFDVSCCGRCYVASRHWIGVNIARDPAHFNTVGIQDHWERGEEFDVSLLVFACFVGTAFGIGSRNEIERVVVATLETVINQWGHEGDDARQRMPPSCPGFSNSRALRLAR